MSWFIRKERKKLWIGTTTTAVVEVTIRSSNCIVQQLKLLIYHQAINTQDYHYKANVVQTFHKFKACILDGTPLLDNIRPIIVAAIM